LTNVFGFSSENKKLLSAKPQLAGLNSKVYGLVKGIGPIMSGRATAKFGLETLEVLEGKAGDIDQLPSVGPGNVLQDIIESGRMETGKLMPTPNLTLRTSFRILFQYYRAILDDFLTPH
jgi:hypothetical protein